MRHVERGVDGWAAVARIGLLPVSRDSRDALGSQIHLADSGIVQVAKVQRAIRADRESVGIIHLGVRESAFAGADERSDTRSKRVALSNSHEGAQAKADLH